MLGSGYLFPVGNLGHVLFRLESLFYLRVVGTRASDRGGGGGAGGGGGCVRGPPRPRPHDDAQNCLLE